MRAAVSTMGRRRMLQCVHLRDVELGDVPAYIAMRCDPAMMNHLGGPQDREGIEAKVQRDVADVATGRAEICMIIADEADDSPVAGTVSLWTHDVGGERVSEIGWMVLPPFQGKGLAKQAVQALLRRADAQRRWGRIHAFPAIDNSPSNGICRSLRFTFAGVKEIEFAGRPLLTNDWYIDPDTYGRI